VGNRFFMQINDSFYNISQVLNGFFDSKMVDFIKIVEKCSAIHILNNEIYVVILLEKAIKFDDIRMVKRTMEFYLFRKLIDHLVLLYFGFLYLFYCCNETCIMMSINKNKIYLARYT